MSIFGAGVSCKPQLVRYNAAALRSLEQYVLNGTGDTTIVAEDTTYGSVIQTTVTNSDNQAGHVYLGNLAPFTLVAGAKFKFGAYATFNHASAEFGLGFSDGFASADTGIFSNTTGAMTSQDSILIYQFSGSAFWRGEVRNATSATASGATTTAATAGTWYKVEVEGEVQTNGIHARWMVDGAVIYTHGYSSGVSPVAASGVDNLQFGWAVKTTTTTEVISKVVPLYLEYTSKGN